MERRPLEYWDEAAFKKIVRKWPEDVRRDIGFALHQVQLGKTPSSSKPLHGSLSAAKEITHVSGARLVYSLAFTEMAGSIYIVDAFYKDSGEGTAMRKSDKERIEGRLKLMKARYQKPSKRMH